MTRSRLVLISCAPMLAWSTACQSGSDRSAGTDLAPQAGPVTRSSAPADVSENVGAGTVALNETAASERVIGHFRTCRGMWQITSTGAGMRYSLSDARGSLLEENVHRARLEELDPSFAGALETGVASSSGPLTAENYLLMSEIGNGDAGVPSDDASAWGANEVILSR